MEKHKRERSVNFTQEETDLLVLLASARKHIIENKKSDAATWQDKENAWKDIETAFNSTCGSIFRNHKHLKLKYEAIKRDTRKKSAEILANQCKTGGGISRAPVLTPAEQKVKEMILSVEEKESCFDSDVVLPCTSTSGSTGSITLSPAEEQNVAPATEQTLREDFVECIVQICEHDSEPPRKRKSEVSKGETDSTTHTQSQSKQWKEWNPTALKTEKPPVLGMPKEKRLFGKLTEEKIELVKIQKLILIEELEQKTIQTKILEKEFQHKDVMLEEELAQKSIQRKTLEKELQHKEVMQKLEKQHLLLKIELLKKNLGEN